MINSRVARLSNLINESGPAAGTAVSPRERGDDLFAYSQYLKAIEAYEKAEDQAKDPEEAACAAYQKGLCFLKSKNAGSAFSAWERLRFRYPKSSYAPKSLREAIRFHDSHPTTRGIADKERQLLFKDYPDSPEAAEVRKEMENPKS